MRSAVSRGAIWAVILTFPLAALCALVYRFPIPFRGYEDGLLAVPLALLAVIFYGVLGGVVVLVIAGGAGGLAAYFIGRPDERRTKWLSLGFAALVALICVITMSILDKIIGPW